MIRRSITWLTVLVATASLVLSACATADEDGAASGTGPVTIVGTLGLTGVAASPSAGYRVAYDYWLEQVNAKGGLLGRQVEMKILDDESTPTTAQQLYQTLLNEDRGDLVLAPVGTAIGAAIAPIVQRSGKVLFSGGFVSKELHSKSDMLVSSWPYQEPEFPKPMFEYWKSLPTDQRPTTLAVVTGQNPFTLVARDGFAGEGGVVNYAREAGMEIVFSEEYQTTATDLTGIVQRAKDSGADAFLALSTPNDGSLIARTVEQLGYAPDFYCQCAAAVTVLPNWPNLGTAALDVYSTTTAWPTQDNFGMKEFAAHMRAELGTDVLPGYSAVGYAMLQVIEQAVEGAGTLDQTTLRRYIAENTFRTVLGDVTYNADGTLQFAALLVQFQPGGNVVIWPKELATGAPTAPKK